MNKWVILDENYNFVMSFKSYQEAIEDAKKASRELGETFSVSELKATIMPESWVRIDVI